MAWWYWLFMGLVLAGAEMISPGGFYLLFFGIAALIVGALAGLGIVETAWLEWLLFSVLTVVSLLLFRGPCCEWPNVLRLMRWTPWSGNLPCSSTILPQDTQVRQNCAAQPGVRATMGRLH